MHQISPQHILYRSETRGYAHHGWLEARHTFSFAGYYNPERIHFGVLRVLNDDRIAGGMGFGTHPHDNMEIITLPLEGALEHRDSMGNTGVIRKGDVQVMSAGTGITHSEYNHHPGDEVKLLQIWVYPNQKNVVPRYDQRTFDLELGRNTLQTLVMPGPESEPCPALWIHQNAWFHRGLFDAGVELNYRLRGPGNGLYAFVIDGRFQIDGVDLGERDGLGITGVGENGILIAAHSAGADLLLMELPLHPNQD